MAVIDIIKDALLDLGAIDLRSTPSAEEAEACLARLQSMLPSLPGWTGWNEIEINADYSPKIEDARIAVIGDVEVSITLPQLVYQDPCISYDSSGNPDETGEYFRAPRDGARILAYAQSTADQAFYAYRADTGQWVNILTLTLSGEVPVNADMYGHLSALLAERVAPVFGVPIGADLGRNISRARLAWHNRYNKFKTVRTEANHAEGIGGYM